MVQDQTESTTESINYGKFINQIPPGYHKIDSVTRKD